MDWPPPPTAQLVGSGRYLPRRVVTNADLQALINTSEAWIKRRTGIEQRHYVEGSEGTADLAHQAALRALEDARLTPDQIDLIIFATLSPDYFFPGSGVLLGALLGIEGVPALDVRNQCSGFLYGLQTADAMIRAGIYRRVLLVGAEVHSTGLDFSDTGRDIAVLFGDGAGAIVLAAHAGGHQAPGVVHTLLGADGSHATSLWCESPSSRQHPQRITQEDLQQGRHFPRMQGRKVFKHAVIAMRDVTRALSEATGVGLDEIDLFIPHQANLRISEIVQRELGVPAERFYNNIARRGNTTAATLPIAIDECRREGRLTEGQLLCLMAFGSGFTWGASLIRI